MLEDLGYLDDKLNASSVKNNDNKKSEKINTFRPESDRIVEERKSKYVEKENRSSYAKKSV